MAGIVFAIGKQQDEVSAGFMIDFAELIETGSKKHVEEGRTPKWVLPARSYIADACFKRSRIAGPELWNGRYVTERHNESVVGVLTQHLLRVSRGDRPVCGEIPPHGFTRIHENPSADGNVEHWIVGKDFARRLAVVRKTQLVHAQ